MWLKWAKNWLKLTDFQTFFGYFHVFQVVEHIRTVLERFHKKKIEISKNSKNSIFGPFLPILATFMK
jgi:hypothetical protein